MRWALFKIVNFSEIKNLWEILGYFKNTTAGNICIFEVKILKFYV